MREAAKVEGGLLISVGSCCPFAYYGVKVALMTWPFVICLVEGIERKRNTLISLPWSLMLLSTLE